MTEQNPSIAQLGMAYDQNIREPDRLKAYIRMPNIKRIGDVKAIYSQGPIQSEK